MSVPASRMRRWLLCAAVLLALTGCTATGSVAAPPTATAGPPSSAPSSAGPPPTGSPGAAGRSVADVVEQLEPSVVTVRGGDGLGSGVVW